MAWKKTLAFLGLILLAGTLVAFPPPADDIARQTPNFTSSPLLEMLPASTPMLLHLKGIQGVEDRFFGFVANALPDVLEKGKLGFKDEITRALDGRKLQGLARSGPHFIAILKFPKPTETFDPKQAIFALRVTDYNAFKDGFLKPVEKKNLQVEKGMEWTPLEGLDTTVYMAKKGNHAVIALSKEAGLQINTKGDSLARRISAAQSKKLLERDYGVYINLDVLHKEYGMMLEGLKKEINNGTNALEFILPKEQVGVLKMLRDAVDGAFQALRDGNGFLATIDFRPTGIVGHAELEYRPDTATSKIFAGAKPSAMEGLAKLPAGHGFYFGQQTKSPILERISAMAMGAMPGEDAKKLSATVEKFLKAPTGIRYDAVSLPASGLQVIETTEPEKIRELFLEMLASLGNGESFQNRMLKGAPKIQKKAKTLSGIDFDAVSLEWDLEKMLEQAGKNPQLPKELSEFQKILLKRTIGDSMNLWVGTKDKEVWITTGKDWEAASAWVKLRLEGAKNLGLVDHYPIVRKDLPQKTDFILLIDPFHYLKLVFNIVTEAKLVPVALPFKFEGAGATFVGFSASFGEDRTSVEGVISSASVREIYERLVKPSFGPVP